MTKRILQKKHQAIFIGIACVLLLLTSVYQQISNKQDLLGLLQQGEPKAEQFKEIAGAYNTFELLDEKGNFLNYAVLASASGYGGPMTMLTIVSQDGKIANAVLTENSETPLYLKKVLAAGYPENLQGKAVTGPLAENEDVDIISGATRTTEGITLAVEKGMYQIGKNQLGLAVPTLKTFRFQWQDGLVVLLLILAVLAAARNLRKLRPWLLAATAVVLGFMANSSLTIGNFMSIVALKMPNFNERPVWYIVVLGVLAVTLLLGKNFYCAWLCPFGAVQEGIYKALNLANYRPNPQLISLARKGRWPFLWLAAMLALLFNNPGIASYEPFAVFFNGDGNTAQWIIMGIILLFGIFVLRFWCRCFCPVGAFLDALALAKRKALALLHQGSVPEIAVAEAEEPDSSLTASGCRGGCAGCQAETMKFGALSFPDKLLASAIAAIWALILGASLQNMGVL